MSHDETSRPGMLDSTVGTVYLLKRAELAVRSCMEVVLKEFDLTPAQFMLLFRLLESQGLSAAALAREVGVRPQSMGEIIGPLERKRLIRRQPSPENRRVLMASLTASGRKLVTEGIRVARRVEAELLVDLSADQVQALQDALTRLWQRAESHEAHPKRRLSAQQASRWG